MKSLPWSGTVCQCSTQYAQSACDKSAFVGPAVVHIAEEGEEAASARNHGRRRVPWTGDSRYDTLYTN